MPHKKIKEGLESAIDLMSIPNQVKNGQERDLPQSDNW